MRKARPNFKSIILAAMLPLTAFAENTPNRASLVNNPKTLAYLTGSNVEGKLLELGNAFDAATGAACAEPATVKYGADQVAVIKPIYFPDSAQHPLEGIWKYRFEFTRCGRTSIFNAAAIAQKDLQPRYITLLPGDTIALPQLQNDALVSVGHKVIIETKVKQNKECRDLAILNTALVTMPSLSPSGSAGGPWEERWLVRYCGKHLSISMCFKPNAQGTALFTAACAEIPPGP